MAVAVVGLLIAIAVALAARRRAGRL